MNIRQAKPSDASRIAEMIVTNYRKNFFPIFKNEQFFLKRYIGSTYFQRTFRRVG